MDGGAVTVFEVLALERLMPYLRGALKYVIAVAAERHPRLLALHAWREEVCLVLSALLEGHALAAHGASFSEHFYGLRRASASSLDMAGLGANVTRRRRTGRQRRKESQWAIGSSRGFHAPRCEQPPRLANSLLSRQSSVERE